jgi:hypothetical protein
MRVNDCSAGEFVYGRTFGVGPEGEDALKDSFELLELGGFFKEGVGAKAVSLENVLLKCRIGHDDDRDDRAFGILPKPLEHFETGHAGHFQVHEDDVGCLAAGLVEGRFAFEEGNDITAISHDLQGAHITAFCERDFEEIDVAGGVLCRKDVQLPLPASYHAYVH